MNKYNFKVRICKIGVNYCVDVPNDMTLEMITVKGTVKEFKFTKSLVSVKKRTF